MEISSDNIWFNEQMIMEDPNFIQLHQMDQHGYGLGDIDYQTLTMESYLSRHSFPTINNEHEHDVRNNYTTESKPFKPALNSRSSSQIISFQNSNSTSESLGQVYGGVNNLMTRKRGLDDETLNVVALISDGSYDQLEGKCFQTYQKVDKERMVGDTTRRPLHAQDHVLAERRRREKLSQRFLALSAILPSLKKMDKASVLEDAIDYVRKLEERVKTLEKQTAVRTVECAVLVKRSHVDAYSTSSFENSDSYLQLDEQSLPDIEARVSDKDVLLKINCENQRGCLAKMLNEIEKLHLSIHKTSVLPFGNSILDITIVARMDVDYSLTAKDLVRNLRKAIVHDFM